MSQFFKNRPVLKVFAALGASCVPLYLASVSIGPSFGKLIDFKRKEEEEQLQKTNTYDPYHWKIRLLDKFKHSVRSPIAYDEKIENNFLKEIAHAEGETPKGFEADFKQGSEQSSKDVHKEANDAADTPDKDVKEGSSPTDDDKSESSSSTPENKTGTPDNKQDEQSKPEVGDETLKPTAQQKIHQDVSEEDESQGRNPVAKNVNKDSDEAPAKKTQAPVAQTTVQGVTDNSREEDVEEAPYASLQSPVNSSTTTAPDKPAGPGSTDPKDTIEIPDNLQDDKLDKSIEPVFEINESGTAPHHNEKISSFKD